jgi:hypothetical protein
MAREEQIIIDVEINVGDTEQRLGYVAKAISGLTEENKKLKKELKDGTGDWAENTAQIKANEAEIKSFKVAEKDLSAILSVSDRQWRTYSDSIRGQAAQLADLKNQYISLTKAERDSAGGKDMLKKLMELDAQVKENDASMGNFQRNVGNYPKVFDLSGTSVGKFQSMLSGLGGTSTTVGGVVGTAFGTMKTQAISLGKAFLTPPIGLIVVVLSAIMFAVQKVVQAFKKNDEASTQLEQALSSLTPIAEGISWVFDKLALVLSKVFLGIGKVISSVLSLIPAYKDAAAAANELVVAQDNLEQTERDYTISSAKNNAEIARIKKEAVNTQKYTNKEIEEMLQRADDLEMENLQNDKNRKEESLRLLKAKAKQEKDTSDATADAIAAAEAAKYQAEESYYSGTMRLASKANAAREKQASQNAAAAKAAAAERQKEIENQEAAAEKAIQISKQLEDAMVEAIESQIEREIAAEKLATQRKIDELNAETDLTAEAVKNRNALIKQLKINSDAKIKELTDKNAKEEQEKLVDAEAEKLRIKNEAAGKEAKNLEDLADRKRQIMENEFNAARLNLERLHADEKSFADLALTEAQTEAQALITMDAATKAALYQSEAEYTADVIEAKRKIVEATDAVITAEHRQLEQQVESIQAFGDAISSVLSEMAGDSREALIFQKLIALANASLNLATAISAATAAGAIGGPAKIAANIASVIVAFAQVTKAMKASKVPEPPKFERGGIVGGSSYTGDNVIARVNSGEMILNFEQQKKLFDMLAMNNNDGRGMIDYDLLARAMSRQPAPVMIYKEFTDFQEKIVTFDEHIKL